MLNRNCRIVSSFAVSIVLALAFSAMPMQAAKALDLICKPGQMTWPERAFCGFGDGGTSNAGGSVDTDKGRGDTSDTGGYGSGKSDTGKGSGDNTSK